MPFLENVTRGRNVPRERLLEVAEHYEHFGGVSPINEQNRALIAALEPELQTPWHRPARLLRQPQLAPAARRHAAGDARRRRPARAGLRHLRLQLLLGLPAVPREPLRTRSRPIGAGRARGPQGCGCSTTIPGSSRRTPTASGRRSSRSRRPATRTSPSRRTRIPAVDGEELRLRGPALRDGRLVAEAVGVEDWQVVYQSRSGPPQVPWLEPDIVRPPRGGGRPRRAAGRDRPPIGFISDHWRCCSTSTWRPARSRSGSGSRSRAPAPPGRTRRSSARSARLIQERLDPSAPRRALGRFGPSHDTARPTAACPGAGGRRRGTRSGVASPPWSRCYSRGSSATGAPCRGGRRATRTRSSSAR